MDADKREALRSLWDRREDTPANGIEYYAELAGPGGIWVCLLPRRGTPKECIELAKAKMRADHDVVSFRVCPVPARWYDESEYKPDKGHAGGWVASARWILEHGCRKVDRKTGALIPEGKRGGVLLDSFSAGAIVQVYDALNETNKSKFAELPVVVAAEMAFKLLSKK